jgi:hypothetical protein
MLKVFGQQTANLWLDDMRPAPTGWTWCKSVAEAQQILQSQTVVEMSFDHDLGQKQDGYDLAKWMAANNKWPQKRPTIHSQNPVGRANIEAVISRYGPY